MKPKNSPLRRNGTESGRPQVLFAGFPVAEAASISSALVKLGWSAIAHQTEIEIERAFASERFDVTVVDAEHLEVFAPQFIARLRDTPALSSGEVILAADNSGFDGLKRQLTLAGADLVIAKPSQPTLYVIDFLRAARLRSQRILAGSI